jgi:DNA-binding NtrC family response regulator
MTDSSAALRRGTLVVATRDARLVQALRSMQGELDLNLDVVAKRRELLERLAPPDGLPHEGEGGWVRIVLLDDDLADGEGKSLLPRLRAMHGDLKVIFTADHSNPRLEVEVRREGVHFFLPKPIDTDLLRKIIAKAVEHESTRNRWKKGLK